MINNIGLPGIILILAILFGAFLLRRHLQPQNTTQQFVSDTAEANGTEPRPPQKESVRTSNREPETHQEIYDRASSEFRRLASQPGSNNLMIAELGKVRALVEQGCQIPGPYTFLADKLLRIQGLETFSVVVSLLRDGHSACSSKREYQVEIENTLFGVGKYCWDNEREDLAFTAYMTGLDYWREGGNTISQDSPLLPRIAFVACRMFSKNAMEQGDKMDMAVRMLDFCEASGVDMNLDIDVSDARS